MELGNIIKEKDQEQSDDLNYFEDSEFHIGESSKKREIPDEYLNVIEQTIFKCY